MKKRTYAAVVALCMALAVSGCSENEKTQESSAEAEKQQETDITEEIQTPEEGDTQESDAAEESKGRLVSVDNVEKYITIGEYKGIVLDGRAEAVTDDDVEKQVQSALKEKSEEVTKKGEKVQTGDTVTINFVGTENGVAFEGGTANNYDLTIGEGTMIPGFEDGIIGMEKGETKELALTFPENYPNAEMAGADTVFQITLLSFRRPPELTDEWAAANTDFATSDEYRASVRSRLEESAQAQAESSRRSTAWTTVFTNSEVKEYPQKDIDDAVTELKRLVQNNAQQGSMELEEFVESQGISMEDFEEQCQQYAQAKVKQDLIIQGIMDAEGMTLEDEESLAIQDQLIQQYGAGDLAALIDTYGQAAVDESIGLVRVVDFIIANATFEESSSAGDTAEDTEPADGAEAEDTEPAGGEGTEASETAENTDAES